MDLDLGTLCLLGIFMIVGFMLLSRMMGGMGRGSSGYGPERPQYDDPNIQGRGGFGADRDETADYGTERPQYDDPSVRGRGFFGGGGSGGSFFSGRKRSGGSSGSSFFGGGSRRSGGNNSPNVRGRGGFGRDK